MSETNKDGYELEDTEEELLQVDEPEAHQNENIQEIEDTDSWQNEIERVLDNLDQVLEDTFWYKPPEIEPEIPDVWWREDIEKIEDLNVRYKKIEEAQEWWNDKNEREEEYRSEDKDLKYFWADNPGLFRKGIKVATSASFATVGLSYDKMADLAEDASRLQAGDLEFVEDKDRVKGLLGRVDPEVGKGLAEKVIEENELSGDDAESLRRLIRLREMGEK